MIEIIFVQDAALDLSRLLPCFVLFLTLVVFAVRITLLVVVRVVVVVLTLLVIRVRVFLEVVVVRLVDTGVGLLRGGRLV